MKATWLRLFDKAGQLIPTAAEAGYVLAEAELARLRAELARLKGE